MAKAITFSLLNKDAISLPNTKFFFVFLISSTLENTRVIRKLIASKQKHDGYQKASLKLQQREFLIHFYIGHCVAKERATPVTVKLTILTVTTHCCRVLILWTHVGESSHFTKHVPKLWLSILTSILTTEFTLYSRHLLRYLSRSMH